MSNGEDEITSWFAAQSSLSPVDFPIGIGDDMAEVRLTPDSTVLVTTDMLLEGSHFDLSQMTIEQVGYKAMAVSLSDCAAMATIPLAAVAAVGLPKDWGKDELKQLHAGILRAGNMFGCKLIGGDITAWKADGAFAVNVTMLSKPGAHAPVTRAGAKAGDIICVTGALGGSLKGKHHSFRPRVDEALSIADIVNINAMMDISDGVSMDLNRICERSGVGALLEADTIPLSMEAQESQDPLASALHDGEDFELLFTLSAGEHDKLMENWKSVVPITAIGRITDSGKVRIKYSDGSMQDLERSGYDHLR